MDGVVSAYLTNRETRTSHEHLLILLARIWVVKVLMEPGAQDIRDRLRQVAPSALILGVDRIAKDAKIGLLGVG